MFATMGSTHQFNEFTPLIPNDFEEDLNVTTELNRNRTQDVDFFPPRETNRMSQFLTQTEYTHSKESTLGSCCNNCLSNFSCKKVINSICPITAWLPEYAISIDLVNDIIAGSTVAILGVPQSLAYALLGNVPPVIGLYMSFFPLFIYAIFGTSRHNSIGTFAVVCLMIGKIVNEHAALEDTASSDAAHYTPVEVATAVTFTVACYQMIMYCFNVGALTSFLSDPLIKGFTTGAAFHVSAAQIPDITGLKLPKRAGIFKLGYLCMDLYHAISTTNLICLGISLICIIALYLNHALLKPRFDKLCKFPFPMELVLVIVFTAISGFTSFYEPFHVVIIGDIPSGLPMPTLPRFELIPSIAIPAFTICVVTYTLTASFTKVFSTKNLYEVNCNQEAFALSMCNFGGSFVSCMPVCVSISRSLVQEQVGGKSQIASCICATFTLVVLLWAGPYFRTLPKCVLASIVIMALRNTVFQASLLVSYFKKNIIDWMVFSATFLCVVLLDIDYGLLVGLVLSLLVLIRHTMTPYTGLYGHLPNTDFYINMNNHKMAKEIPNIKIFHYGGGLSFAQTEIFKNKLYKCVGLNPITVTQARKKELRKRLQTTRRTTVAEPETSIYLNVECIVTIKFIILDFSNVTFIDPSGVDMLSVIATSFQAIGVRIFIAATTDPVFQMIRKTTAGQKVTPYFSVYPSIHDAVLAAREALKLDLES